MEGPAHNLRKPVAKGLFGLFRSAAPHVGHAYVVCRWGRERCAERRAFMPCP